MLAWAIGVGISVPVIFMVSVLLQAVIANTTDVVINFMGAALVYSIAAAAAFCALLAVGVGRRPRSRRYVVVAAVMGVLAGLAPISLVIYLRLSVHACVVLNTFGLPWPEPWREIAHVLGGLIWLASLVCLIVGVIRPAFRRAGVALWIWSGAIAIPTIWLFFFTVYGDPAPGCTPV